MDFLDPRKRRSHTIRLVIGYFLVSVAVALGTVILVYGAYGYGINTKTGDLIQNGLLFADSKPSGAQVFLNGQYQNVNTGARLVLPAGKYTLDLKRSGYHDWTRAFTLDEHSIIRLVYPFLFPIKPFTSELKTYSALPPLVTQSPDQRRVLVQVPGNDAGVINFDEYDTGNLKKAPLTDTLPSTVLSDGGASSQLSAVEWSSDNNHILLRHIYAGGDEYILFDRTKPDSAINLNKLFKITPSQVSLFNKKTDQVYLFDAGAGTLQLGNLSTGVVGKPILDQVLAYKPYGADLITYVTNKSVATGKVQARIWNNGQTYGLYTFNAGSHYLIDAAQYQGHFYYAAGSDSDANIDIFEDPLDSLKNPAVGKAAPLLSLNELGATSLSFSDNAQYIEAENGQNFAVYDAETNNFYQYQLAVPITANLTWMDGDRMIGQSGDQVFVMDYDSTNQQVLAPTVQASGGVFSRDYNHLLTLQNQPDGSVKFINVDMRAGTDLPANP